MSGFSNKINGVRAITLEPQNIKFSVFSTEEMKKLCITKITTPLTFDEMGHPLIGGLYDKTLGPLTDRGEVCGTCFKNIYNCPGHFGYIDLPLPVVNPLFHKTVGTIMKMTCLSCYGLQLPVHSKRSLELQMKLVDGGYITEAIEIATKLKELISKYESISSVPEDEIKFIREYEKLVTAELPDTEKHPNKNTECMKNAFLSDVLSEYKSRKICLECREPLDKIQFVRKKLTLYPNPRKTNADDDFKLGGPKNITPTESREILRKVWEKEKDFLKCLIPLFENDNMEYPTDVFFMEIISVTPNNLRPVNFVDGRITENQQTGIYKTIIQDCMLLRAIIQVFKKKGDTSALPIEAKAVYNTARGQTPLEKLKNAWESLQFNVDNIADYNAGRITSQTGMKGLKQVIEKKEGILRKHMMGKRVNFSARSVITPDPYLNVDEIGIPEVFAKQLTYPVPVTSWNVAELRKMIMNGPDKHPGANMVEFEDGSLVRINPKNPTQKQGILKRLLTPDEKDTKAFRGVKKVHRHMCNGDVVLANRQPTLHKPSIMAHTVRILKNEKTIRVHYSNCKAYNADFDGDEMNVHFPQNELARSEGYNLVHVSQQYLVPKDGTPLGGLIQDYMVSGVKMTIRGKFFNKVDYQHLVFQALSFKTSEIKLLPPSIIKPACLWSGKQIISTIIINIIPKNKRPINLTSSAKLGAKAWETSPPRPWNAGGTPFDNPNTMTEAEVIIRNGELLVGVIDKIHCGATPYGLVHCMYELYGGQYAIKLLSAFSKVFTSFLQTEGFTLGVHDILVLPHADKERRKIIKKSRKIGPEVVATALDMPKDSSLDEIVEKLEEASARNPKMKAIIDRQYKTSIDEYTNKINKVCLPAGLLCKFPENNLQLMVQSGAKGSTVNTMQISCLLGQIELEGKRPPVMISGKSLPSFPVFEFSPRAGGFIDGRFMTGIKPQEFFFHCMAGREGLIDTAVKTSRSGYLQRCLIKHLEGLTVNYDLTVRDSDKSIVQFLYGEDGMDVCKAQFLQSKQMDFLMENSKAIIDKKIIKSLKKDPEKKRIEEQYKAIDDWKERHGSPLDKKRTSRFALFSEHAKNKLKIEKLLKIKSNTGRSKLSTAILDLWTSAEDEIKEGFGGYCRRCPNPVNADYQADCHYGSLSDRMKLLLDNYKSKKPIGKERKSFEDMLKFKYMQSMCSPGEPIGILAAQSIGEPSTQMTLNTFHFAGRGEMNVTLGIPRLREILMYASKSMKTPSMEIPFKNIPNLEKEAEKLRKKLTRVTLENVLERIEVSAQLGVKPVRQQLYTVKFHFLPQHLYEHEYPIKAKRVIKAMTTKFFGLFFMTIRRSSKVKSVLVNVEQERKKSRKQINEDDDDDDGSAEKDKKFAMRKNEGGSDDDEDSGEEPEDAEDAKQTSKYSQVHEDQEPEEEEKEKEVSDDEDGEAMDTTVTNEENSKKKKNQEHEEEEEEDEDDTAFSMNSIKGSHNLAQNYTYDKKKYLWCELTFALPLNWKKLDLRAILKESAAKCVLHEVPDIKRAITYMKKDQLTLRTDGINIIEMFKYNELLDLNKLYCNDIHKMAETYGIEAAVKVLVQEITDVFEVYGIKVDPRHLSLIADYMTSGGAFEPMNRKGLQNSASPLQQISFEASLHFLKESTIRSREDYLSNPSSCLIVGKPCQTGTGIFSVMVKIPQTVA